ncbi:MAG TPA: ClbS/DfsB family four-helix bundle protein [Candidatus Limnocylindria bacterium]|nr:ClbS/DfsB family four-helix bundle protein [Candidatus Limnocylindria bacterium]
MASTTIPATSSELLARVDDAWRPFREAVRGVGRARMNESTGAGWTFRDLLAHVAAWHDLTTRRLREFRETGTFAGPGDEVSLGLPAFRDADEFNARVMASHRLVGAEALVDELDTAFRSLRSELATLSEEQIHANDDWVFAIVTANTFGHYAEHAQELWGLQ